MRSKRGIPQCSVAHDPRWAVDDWGNEVRYWKFTPTQDYIKNAGHFTQVGFGTESRLITANDPLQLVWKGSTKIGVGRTESFKGSRCPGVKN